MVETNYLAQLPGHRARWLAVRISHLEIAQPKLRHRKRLIYLLSNVIGVESSIAISLDGMILELRPIEDYASNLRRIQALRGVLPTAQMEINTAAQVDRVTRVVDEACYLLSLALGTKVQWIAMTEETKAHQWIRRHHFLRVTKHYCPLSVLDRSTQVVSNYLRQAEGGRFRRAREQSGLSDAVIDTYLDAKSEGDFLQVRALKLVVAVEMLKAEYIEKSGAPSFIVAPEAFETSAPELKKVLRASFGQKEDRAAMYANLNCLNRTSFSNHLRSVCAAVRVPVDPEDLDRFVASRNKLVHEGRFYCENATDREKKKVKALASVEAEWFWLLHFVDRLFLRALDYEGPYIDWSTPSTPVRALLSPSAEPDPCTRSVGFASRR